MEKTKRQSKADYHRVYRAEHREQYNAYHRKYYAANKDRILAQHRAKRLDRITEWLENDMNNLNAE